MLRKLMIVALTFGLGAWGLWACDDGGDADADADADGDTDTDADGDGGWPCEQASADAPSFRVTSLDVQAPTALSNALLQGIIDSSVDEFQFVWLLDLDLTANTMSTGSGRGVGANPVTENFCEVTWNADYPAANDIPITLSGDAVSTTGPIATLSIPMYSSEDMENPMLVLPLSQLEILDVELSADRTLVGSMPTGTTQYAANWVEAGTVRGWISAEDAMDVPVESLNQTLCGLLSGDTGDATTPDDDCSSPQAEWTNQPSEIPNGGGAVGYELEANIGAGAVTIGS